MTASTTGANLGESLKPDESLPSRWRRRVFGLLMLCLGLAGPAIAEIVATSDRDPVSLGESFNLVFSADEEPDAAPDFAALSEDFEILRQGKSARVNLMNGRLSRRTEWTLTLTAKRPGSLTVPPIAFGNDRSNPLTLTVLPGRTPSAASAGSGDVLLEVGAEPRNPYVQAQVVFTIRILHRVALRGGQLEDPKLGDAVVQKLGEDRRYQIERNGDTYGVIERRFAIFPQKSGPLRIEPVALEAEASRGAGSMFDEFFGPQGRLQRLHSEAVTLQVRPIPQAFKGKQWLPAAKLEIEESWSSNPPQTKVGEPITRTLSVRADGATMGMLPELSDKAAGSLPGLQQYPDQPALKEEFGSRGMSSSRREKTAFIPSKDGAYRIPGTEIAWWNTTTDRLEVARIPEKVLSATPAAQTTPPEDTSGTAPDAPEEAVVPSGTVSAPAAHRQDDRAGLWFWLTWLFASGWLGTLLMWRVRSGRSKVEPRPRVEPAPDLSRALKILERACTKGDAVAARQAVLEWSAARWPSDPPPSLEQVGARLGGELPEQMAGLNRALYGETSGEWRGEAIYRTLSLASKIRHTPSTAARGGEVLESLHRL